MDLAQLKQTIQNLPQDSLTRPHLLELVAQVASIGSSVAGHVQAHAQQQPAAPPGVPWEKERTPLHPYGPCNNPQCQSCAQAAQEAVMFGRQSFMGDLDSALAWANRRDIAEIVTDLYADWERAGKPQPVGA